MESVCSYLLTSYFNDPNFKDIFSRIEMSDTKAGKIAFLKATGLIEKYEARFIIGLSELRNRVVHNIEGVHFSFLDHLNKLEKNQSSDTDKHYKIIAHFALSASHNNHEIAASIGTLLNLSSKLNILYDTLKMLKLV